MAVDFIEAYAQALSPEYCRQLIAKFEASQAKLPGVTGQGLNSQAKDSQDINISLVPEWASENQHILTVTRSYLVQYMRKYPHMLTGAVALSFPDPQTGEIMPITTDTFPQLSDSTMAQLIVKLYRPGTINLQKYGQGRGGYHHFHSEIYPQAPAKACEALHRVVLFMYYLNDVAEGGETEFYYQERQLKPTAGQLVIAPTGFTHTHKGHIPLSDDKYILTSWILFQRAETLYGT